MAIEVFNRKEIKYFLTANQVQKLIQILPQYMDCDSYNKDGKVYTIKNLYLDTNENLLIQKSIEKPVYKEKLRLRSYGTPLADDVVYLEIKKKFKSMVNKRRTPLLLSEAYEYINNHTIPENTKINVQVLREIDFMMERYKLSPKVLISYDRLAYFGKQDSDFRLTLDTNIRTTRDCLKLEEDSSGELLLDKDVWLMEAKAFKAFPLWFVHFLSENKIYSVSFSKYGTEYKKYMEYLLEAI